MNKKLVLVHLVAAAPGLGSVVVEAELVLSLSLADRHLGSPEYFCSRDAVRPAERVGARGEGKGEALGGTARRGQCVGSGIVGRDGGRDRGRDRGVRGLEAGETKGKSRVIQTGRRANPQ